MDRSIYDRISEVLVLYYLCHHSLEDIAITFKTTREVIADVVTGRVAHTAYKEFKRLHADDVARRVHNA